MKKIAASLLFMSFAFGITAQSNTTHVSTKQTDSIICMVTTNESGTENEIVWKLSVMPQADSVIVFSLNETGLPTEIGRQAAKDGVFIHKEPNGAGPISSSHTYVIKSQDKANKLSQQSLPHKSIFIDGNGKGEFSWNAYEIAPKDPTGKVNYTLWRKAKDGKVEEVLKTDKLVAIDPKFKEYEGKDALWWITLDNFPCDGGRTRTKSNQSNE